MSLQIQILIGIIIGLIFGFFAVLGAINAKEKELADSWANLSETLNIRYLKLKNVLNFLKKHMTEFHSEIDKLIELLDESADVDNSLKSIAQKLAIENAINFRLEEIKSNMQNYPSLQEDVEVDNAILAIAESETYVGDAIRVYNSNNLEYKVLLDTFPISFVAWVLSKNPEAYLDFTVSTIEEFDESYIDEDEI